MPEFYAVKYLHKIQVSDARDRDSMPIAVFGKDGGTHLTNGDERFWHGVVVTAVVRLPEHTPVKAHTPLSIASCYYQRKQHWDTHCYNPVDCTFKTLRFEQPTLIHIILINNAAKIELVCG